MDHPIVSILIPCYNAAPWLAACIQSALGQTWPHTEVIVVDDGSSDESLSIAREFESRGVRTISQNNAGASAARNRAMRAAQGDFFQFLDADDLLSLDKIALQMQSLMALEQGTVASCAWGRFTNDPSQARFIDTVVFRDFCPLEFLILAGLTGAMIHPSAWLVPRNIANKAGDWNETLSLNDDGEYFARVLLASHQVKFVAGAQSFYRSSLQGSLSQQRSNSARRSQFHSIELVERCLLDREDSPRVRRAVAGYYRRFVHDFYPAPSALIRRAANRVAELGENIPEPAMGPKSRTLSRIIGWKMVYRLKHLLRR